MLRKEKGSIELEALEARVKELETEIESIKISTKSHQHQQASEKRLGINTGRIIGKTMMNSGMKGFSEKQFADKIMKVFSSSFKKLTPSSFMR